LLDKNTKTASTLNGIASNCSRKKTVKKTGDIAVRRGGVVGGNGTIQRGAGITIRPVVYDERNRKGEAVKVRE